MTIAYSEVAAFNPSAEVELFILDLNPIGVATTYYFATGKNQLGASIVWQGVTYQPLPIQADGFEKTTQGAMPRPKIRVSNLDGTIGALVRQYGDLVGARVTRKRTLAKFLDAVNFPGGVNASADPTQVFPDDVYDVNQKTEENSLSGTIEWELRASMDLAGYKVPRRIMQSSVCAWRPQDTAICQYAASCGKKISDCKANWGTAKLPFGGFPGLGLTGLS